MASTKINGTKVGLYISSTLLGAATSHTLSVSSDMADVTTKDSGGWKEIIPALKEWSIDIDALVAWDQTGKSAKDIFDALTNRTLLSVKLRTAVTGDEAFYGDVYVTSFEKNSGMEEGETYSLSLEGTGALARETNT